MHNIQPLNSKTCFKDKESNKFKTILNMYKDSWHINDAYVTANHLHV